MCNSSNDFFAIPDEKLVWLTAIEYRILAYLYKHHTAPASFTLVKATVAKQLGCSRTTVNYSIARLTSIGILTRLTQHIYTIDPNFHAA